MTLTADAKVYGHTKAESYLQAADKVVYFQLFQLLCGLLALHWTLLLLLYHDLCRRC